MYNNILYINNEKKLFSTLYFCVQNVFHTCTKYFHSCQMLSLIHKLEFVKKKIYIFLTNSHIQIRAGVFPQMHTKDNEQLQAAKLFHKPHLVMTLVCFHIAPFIIGFLRICYTDRN